MRTKKNVNFSFPGYEMPQKVSASAYQMASIYMENQPKKNVNFASNKQRSTADIIINQEQDVLFLPGYSIALKRSIGFQAYREARQKASHKEYEPMDNLPSSPKFPISMYRPSSPIKGAFNHVEYAKYTYYTVNGRGVIIKKPEVSFTNRKSLEEPFVAEQPLHPMSEFTVDEWKAEVQILYDLEETLHTLKDPNNNQELLSDVLEQVTRIYKLLTLNVDSPTISQMPLFDVIPVLWHFMNVVTPDSVLFLEACRLIHEIGQLDPKIWNEIAQEVQILPTIFNAFIETRRRAPLRVNEELETPESKVDSKTSVNSMKTSSSLEGTNTKRADSATIKSNDKLKSSEKIQKSYDKIKSTDRLKGTAADRASTATLRGQGSGSGILSGFEAPTYQKLEIAATLASNPLFRSPNEKALASLIPKDPFLSDLVLGYIDASFTETLEAQPKEDRKAVVGYMVEMISKFSKLVSVAQGVSSELVMNHSLDMIVKETSHICGCEKAKILLVDKNNQEYYVYNEPRSRFPLNVGISGQVYASKDYSQIDDVTQAPSFVPNLDSTIDVVARNLLVFPIINQKNDFEGVLIAINKIDNKLFSNADRFLARMLSRLANSVITTARAYDKIREGEKKVSVLLSTTKTLSSELELVKLIQVIMYGARELLNADRCTLFLVDQEKGELWSQVQAKDGLTDIRFSQNVGIAGYVSTTGETINIHDAYKDPRFNPAIDKQTGYTTRSILCMPIRNNAGAIIGVTQIINKLSGTFTQEDENLLAAFSAQASVALEKSYMFKRAEELRMHFEDILNSIKFTIMTFNESGMMTSINRTWFLNAFGRTEEEVSSMHYTQWITGNQEMMDDIRAAYEKNEARSKDDYPMSVLNGPCLFVSYSIMPLSGSKGLVMLVEERSGDKRVECALQRYMAPFAIQKLLGEGWNGSRQKASLVYSEIQSFNELSSTLEVSKLLELLNRHCLNSSEQIYELGGILDSFTNGGLLALFGMPGASTDANNACACALNMQKTVASLNELFGADLQVGIGIDCGQVVCGMIDIEKRIDYCTIGRPVESCKFLQSLCSSYGVSIVISQGIVDSISGFCVRKLDVVAGVSIFELVGVDDESISPVLRKCHELYVEGLESYLVESFEIALEKFRNADDICDDAPSKVMAKKCEIKIMTKPVESQ